MFPMDPIQLKIVSDRLLLLQILLSSILLVSFKNYFLAQCGAKVLEMLLAIWYIAFKMYQQAVDLKTIVILQYKMLSMTTTIMLR